MIAVLLLVAQAAGPAAMLPAPSTASSRSAAAGIPPVVEWSSLPVYPMPHREPITDASAYVRTEIEAGRCRPIMPLRADGVRVVATVAILMGPGGVIRRMVPQAIGCPTVEQFTVGYLSSQMRGADTMLRPAPGWYRSTVTYRW